MYKIPSVINREIVGYIFPSEIDLASSSLSIFKGDGSAYTEVTVNVIDKIIDGSLIITEYHEQALGNVIYTAPNQHSFTNKKH